VFIGAPRGIAFLEAQQHANNSEDSPTSSTGSDGALFSQQRTPCTKQPRRNSKRPRSELPTPVELHQDIPMSPRAKQTLKAARHALQNTVEGTDDRLLVLVGPCSIHDSKAALEYAAKLLPLAKKHSRHLVVVMRAYFEKPRTTVGWRGLISDPHLDGSCDIATGLRTARQLLLDINELGMPCGTEFLNPVTAHYISDLIAYGTIGARTTESQIHREMAAGLGMPVGFKNATSGEVQVAVDAIRAAAAELWSIGTNKRGKPSIVHGAGNRHGHLILRGGAGGPNFSASHVAEATARLEGTPLVIDCSHGNSLKKHQKQHLVAKDAAEQISKGCTKIIGVMLESNLVAGNQTFKPGQTNPDELQYGQSVTDACIDMMSTTEVLDMLAKAVQERRACLASSVAYLTGGEA